MIVHEDMKTSIDDLALNNNQSQEDNKKSFLLSSYGEENVAVYIFTFDPITLL